MRQKKSIRARDRVREIRTVRVGDVRPHPKNWRVHPESQRAALTASLQEVGSARVPLVYEHEGNLTWIDGHLWGDLLPDQEMRVAILDVTDKEAEYLLATLDPIAALANRNENLLREVLSGISTKKAAMKDLLASLKSRKSATLSQATERKSGAQRAKEAPQPVIAYNIIFDTTEQQDLWFEFLKWLKGEFPTTETVAERLAAHIQDRMIREGYSGPEPEVP